MNIKCKVEKKCGGCSFITKEYNEQLNIKQKTIEKLISKYGKVDRIIGMKEPLYYRNKVHAAFGRDKKGNVISGIYEESTHKIVDIESCFLENEKADAIILSIKKLLKSFKLTTYDERSGRGFLRHVLIRTAHETGQVLVVLVTGTNMFPSKNNFIKVLRKEHPEITTIVQNINDKRTSMILGEREIVLFGKGYIEDYLCGKKFKISPKSFYQVNSLQTEVLYGKAIECGELSKSDRIIDAYCGIGTIGLIAADYVKEVIGVELNQDAFKDALINKKINNIKNISFVNADAGDFMVAMAEENESIDVVFMDPPRAGSTKEFINSVVKMNPEKVVYISCNPETLARDLEYFKSKKYIMKRAIPVDMFPFTEHVETVVLLSQLRQKPDDYIDVDIDVAELEGTSAETKATYEKIKKYVAEHNEGMKVSSLYIAQVKDKYGIIERENFNKPKSEEAKQPQCPVDKEKAIVEALKYFQMI